MSVLYGFILALILGFISYFLIRFIHYRFIKFKRSRRFIKSSRKYRYILISFFITLILIPFSSYLINFKGIPISLNLAVWGQLGDFFGGLLNPIFAFCSFIALLYTIKLQSKEMSETRQEMMRSRKAQEMTTIIASKQLEQQIALLEYSSLLDILSMEIDKIEKIYNRDLGSYSIDFLMDFILEHSFENKTHSEIKNLIVTEYKQAVNSSHADNFVISIQNVQRTANAMLKYASVFKLDGENSTYYQFMVRLATYCALASFIPQGHIIALRTDNKVLNSCIISYFDQFEIDVSEFNKTPDV